MATAAFQGQWASVTVLAVVAAAVWGGVLYVERQPLADSDGQQAGPFAPVHLAADPPSTDAAAEIRRQ